MQNISFAVRYLCNATEQMSKLNNHPGAMSGKGQKRLLLVPCESILMIAGFAAQLSTRQKHSF